MARVFCPMSDRLSFTCPETNDTLTTTHTTAPQGAERLAGHGWTEHCPKCDHARLYGWRSAIQMQNSAACRARIELSLGQTHRGRERLEHTKLRFDRRQAALAAFQDNAQLASRGR